MDFIHDATGSLATFTIYALVISGAAMFLFRYVRKYIPIGRKTYLKVHQLVTLLFLALLIVHFLTTDKGNIYVMSAIFLLSLIILSGFSLRIKSLKATYFKKVIYGKIALFIIAMVLLNIGHGIFEKEHKENEEYSSIYLKQQ